MREFDSMLSRLSIIRLDLSQHQNEKLARRWDEYGDYRKFGFNLVKKAVLDELNELKDAIEQKGFQEIKDEILDVRNTTEFLWDMLSRRR